MHYSLETSFTFHPIGQGCFYTGQIRRSGCSPFFFVYDCGTYSKHQNLQQAITGFKELCKGKLDLLLISHFDNDHVNEVLHLLRNPDLECRRLIIPYYFPGERLRLVVNTEEADPEYRRMMRDPVLYFSEMGNIKEIIVIGAPDDKDEIENGNLVIPPGDKPPFDNGNNNTGTLGFDDDYDKERADSFYESIPSSEQRKLPKIKYIAIPYRLSVGIATWEFLFYLKKGNEYDIIIDFNKAVDTLVKEYGGSIYTLFEEEPMRELKKRYKTYIGGTMNSTSLVTYHGPAFRINNEDYGVKSSIIAEGDKFSTLLTGDIDMDGVKKIKSLERYFGGNLENILCFQVPHHGSANNWLIQPTKNVLHGFPHYIINHGLGRPHHPGEEVITDIQVKCPDAGIHLNNEVSRFDYEFKYFSWAEDFGILDTDIPASKPLKFKRLPRKKT